jgi:hypothetical protein
MPKEAMPLQTKMPSCCPHCHKLLGRAPGWLRILEAMSPGQGNRDVVYTKAALAKASGMFRQQVEQVFEYILTQGLIEKAPGVAGVEVYRKTPYGVLVLSRWKTAGWKPSKLTGGTHP